jgi:DNA invertase Pin-like site-specific DNA recombinase
MKTEKKCAIYARVSTEEQSYEQQIDACSKFCEIKGWDSYEIFKEVQSSVKERPVWNDLLKRARQGEFNAIVVYRLDRAWRSSRQFIMDFDNLQSLGITVISVMEGLDPSTPIGKAMMTILVALGELERTNISEATKQRLQALKKMGKKLGRPKGRKDSVRRNRKNYFGNTNASNKGGTKKPKNA